MPDPEYYNQRIETLDARVEREFDAAPPIPPDLTPYTQVVTELNDATIDAEWADVTGMHEIGGSVPLADVRYSNNPETPLPVPNGGSRATQSKVDVPRADFSNVATDFGVTLAANATADAIGLVVSEMEQAGTLDGLNEWGEKLSLQNITMRQLYYQNAGLEKNPVAVFGIGFAAQVGQMVDNVIETNEEKEAYFSSLLSQKTEEMRAEFLNIVNATKAAIEETQPELIEKLKEQRENCYAAIPEIWARKVELGRPQTIYLFGEVRKKGVGPAQYQVCVPWPKEKKPKKPFVEQFKKGQWMGTLVLADGSKVIVNCIDQAEAERVITAVKSVILPYQVKNAVESYGVRRGPKLKEITVKCSRIRGFKVGHENNVPSWEWSV